LLSALLRRLLWMIPTTLGIIAVVFGLYHAVPGDPAAVMLGLGGGEGQATSSDQAARREALRRELGLDRSLWVQFFDYLGPFNLSRDGHPWFSSPYSERRVERRRDQASGASFVAGEPQAIVPLPGTPRARAEALSRAAADLASGAAGAEQAQALLSSAGREALPALLTALWERAYSPGGEAVEQVTRLGLALEALTKARLDPPAGGPQDPPQLARVEAWFGWYFTAGGGARVQNSGERPYGGLLALDLGRELVSKRPVAGELLRRLWVSLPLSLAAVLLSYGLALPLGIFSARRQGRTSDSLVTLLLFLLYSVPTFWAGLMLALLFGKTGLDWLPVVGLADKDAASFTPLGRALDLCLHALLPVFTLTYGSLAYLSRQMRSGLLEVIQADYVRTARAKGLPERRVIYVHALRNALIPMVTLVATILPVLIGGSIIVEVVFDLPGMGKYAYEGLLRRDFHVVMATTLLTGVMTQLGILASDLLYTWVDPRIQAA
jgi:peptide/nickel transport system permease protein